MKSVLHVAGLLAATLLAGAPVMAMPRLPTAAELVGPWRIAESGGRTCALSFRTQAIGNAHALDGDHRCLAALGLAEVAAWRPASDGVALAAADGRTVVFFSRQADGRHTPAGPNPRPLVLTQVASPEA